MAILRRATICGRSAVSESSNPREVSEMKKGMHGGGGRGGRSSAGPKSGYRSSHIAGSRNRVVTDHPHANRNATGSKGSNPSTVDTPDWQ